MPVLPHSIIAGMAGQLPGKLGHHRGSIFMPPSQGLNHNREELDPLSIAGLEGLGHYLAGALSASAAAHLLNLKNWFLHLRRKVQEPTYYNQGYFLVPSIDYSVLAINPSNPPLIGWHRKDQTCKRAL